MNDETPAPPPGSLPPVEVAAKKKPRKLLWNKEALDELDLAEKVAQAAKEPNHARKLKERALPDDHADALLARIHAARTFSADAVQASADAHDVTGDESDERKSLVAALRGVQAAARQEYHADSPEQLVVYAIGTKIDALSFARLTGVAEAILTRLQAKPLPGITPEKVSALQATLSAYKVADTHQSGKSRSAETLRQSRDDALAQIRKDRQKIQFAADGAWPPTDPTSKPIRDAFHLPPTRPYTG